MAHTEPDDSIPSVPLMQGISIDDLTIERDGTHTGPAVKRIDADTDLVTVFCPCGHYVARMPVSMRHRYYTGSVTCEGSLPGFPR